MINKIEKLNQLSEMFKSGTITQKEFDTLKDELIKDNSLSDLSKNINESNNKVKIFFEPFYDKKGNKIEVPNIQFLDYNNILDVEIDILKPFLTKKIVFSPEDFTNDEYEILCRIFTESEILKIGSERPGFNYGFQVSISLVAALSVLIMMIISPCLIIIAASGLLACISISIKTLLKKDSTKLDKIFSYISLSICLISIIIYFYSGNELLG
ncbi:MAG: hypothetical protein KFKLKKLM_00333 [Flavobacteriales bacterium]|nr:hypothetical protein [Flavobacteriales bacterium]